MEQIVHHSHESPFDQIKQTDGNGIEYWSARDLMPLLGYGKWERFADSIQRAMNAIENTGAAVLNNVSRSREASGRTNRENFLLSRYACYMVAMNGDPRKPEVAAAQSYFAIQTHVAETQVQEIPDHPTALRGWADELEARKAAEQRAAISEARIDTIEKSDGYSIRAFHKQYFPDTPEREFFELLYKKKLLIDQRGSRGRDTKGRLKNGKSHMHPAAAGKPYFHLATTIDKHNGARYHNTEIRPGTPETELISLLEGYGLKSNKSQTALFKEIA